MKTVSLKKLKEKGWELTPESKKAEREQKAAITLSKQVEAITNLAGKLDRLTKSIKSIVIPQTAVIESESIKGWNFVIKRNREGFISEIMAEKN